MCIHIYRALLESTFCSSLPSHGIPRAPTWPFAEMPLGTASTPLHGSPGGKLRCAPYFEHLWDIIASTSEGPVSPAVPFF